MNKLLFLSIVIICLLSTSVFSKEFSNNSLQTEYPNNKPLNSDILFKKVDDINSKKTEDKKIGIPLKYSANKIQVNPITKSKNNCPYCEQIPKEPPRATTPTKSPCFP
ncbi:hypothetical protein ACNPMZ_07705 [Acinetobacter pittii]|uniref:hypothetical protein n=1 Tax=Acinetobacter TaxID=469 RepID=UPI001BD08D54|nr:MULTISPECIES: hypothetical protein [Acinetobacter]MDV8150157.1 hypothetical protein [Acinetobacter pittii]QVR68805.1 hypothetical protein KIP84_04365 [Acinetobacter sp. BHS4]